MAVAVGISPIAVMQFFDNTGRPAVGGSLLTQVGGVNYPTYSDPNGTIALPNPIPLNSRGECSTSAGSSSTVFLQQGITYTFTLSDKNGNQLWSLGNIASNNLSIPFASTSGTNAIVATFSPAITSLYDGLTIEIKLANTTTASPTFNPNGLGALNVYYSDGVTQWAAGAGIQNVTYTLVYNSSLNSSAGGWEVQNPSRSTGSATITIATGLTTTPTCTLNYALDNTGFGVDAWVVIGTTGTSNATGMTVSGWPTIIQRTSTVFPILSGMTDNGVNTWGDITGLTTGTVTFRKNAVAANFTSTGTKGITSGMSVHYTKD